MEPFQWDKQHSNVGNTHTTLIMGDSPARATYPPTTITYIPTKKKNVQITERIEESKQVEILRKPHFLLNHKTWIWAHPTTQKLRFTNFPLAETEPAGEWEFDDAGSVVEKQTAAVGVGGGDQNALQPCALEEDAAEGEAILRRHFSSVFQLTTQKLQCG